MKIKTTIVALTLAAFGLGACSEDTTTEQPTASESATPVDAETEAFLEAHDLGGLDTRAIIDKLDAQQLADRPAELYASIRPNDLLLSDGETEILLPMPEDSVYVSVAPYVSQTHECYYHSLTTCLGEQRNQDVEVSLVDSDGQTIVEETITSFDNGFVGLWVPREVDGTLTMSVDGVSGSVPFTTSGDDYATCVTTLVMN